MEELNIFVAAVVGIEAVGPKKGTEVFSALVGALNIPEKSALV